PIHGGRTTATDQRPQPGRRQHRPVGGNQQLPVVGVEPHWALTVGVSGELGHGAVLGGALGGGQRPMGPLEAHPGGPGPAGAGGGNTGRSAATSSSQSSASNHTGR